MSIHQQIKSDTVAALKARDQKKREALSFIASELNRVAKDEKLDHLPDERAVSLLRKCIKQRQETIEAAKTSGRQDLLESTSYEVGLIEDYLPAGLNPDQIKALAEKVIAELGATTVKDMGRVIQKASQEAPSVDKSQLSGVVKSLLAR